MQKLLHQDSVKPTLTDEKLLTLTYSEWRVLLLLSDDHQNSEISDKLSIATKTVEIYVTRIGSKLDLKGKSNLARAARKNVNVLKDFFCKHY